MNTRTTYRRRPVWAFSDGYDLDGVELLHARLWDVYAQQWRWFWSYDHIPQAVRASLTQRERVALRRNLAAAPQPEAAR